MPRQPRTPPNPDLHRKVNKWAARVIPLLLSGLVGYSIWVVVALISVNYLIHPPGDDPAQVAAGAVIIALEIIVMFYMALCYFGVIYIINTNPGVVPLPESSGSRKSSLAAPANKSPIDEEADHEGDPGFLNRSAVHDGRMGPPSGLEQFYMRDVFECEIDGLPRWCSTCQNWKPDRSHHCSELKRCVHKMDHFCPWTGGIISETSFKCFSHFVFVGAMFNLFNLIVSAVYVTRAHQKRELFNTSNSNWVATVVMSAFFFLFSCGLAANSVRYTVTNSSTIVDITRKMRITHFAVLMSPAQQLALEQNAAINLPNKPENETATANSPSLPKKYPTVTYPLADPTKPTPIQLQRKFAIIPMPLDSNPFQLSSYLENSKSIMGERWYHWLNPLRRSPCTSHEVINDLSESGTTARSMYKLGPVFKKALEEHGLAGAEDERPATAS